MKTYEKYLNESMDGVYRYNELLVLLSKKNKMGHEDYLNRLKGADEKIQKKAAKIFQQAIDLLTRELKL